MINNQQTTQTANLPVRTQIVCGLSGERVEKPTSDQVFFLDRKHLNDSEDAIVKEVGKRPLCQGCAYNLRNAGYKVWSESQLARFQQKMQDRNRITILKQIEARKNPNQQPKQIDQHDAGAKAKQKQEQTQAALRGELDLNPPKPVAETADVAATADAPPTLLGQKLAGLVGISGTDTIEGASGDATMTGAAAQ